MTNLFELQDKQVEHDKEFHRDIFFLNYQDRFKHMVMHYGKYSGRLAELLKNEADDKTISKEIKRTLVDCFIIVLSVSDLLQLNLDERLRNKLQIRNEISIRDLSISLKESSPDLYNILSSGNEKERLLNLMLEYTSIAGYMQKVGEDLDHMVGFDRNVIRDQTLNILSLLLLSSMIWNIDYEEEVPKRWNDLTKRTFRYGPQ